MNILAGPIQSMIWPYTFISLYMGDATIIYSSVWAIKTKKNRIFLTACRTIRGAR